MLVRLKNIETKFLIGFGFVGFLFPFLEPITLLILGDDLGGAFWPMAIRTLDFTMLLRDYRSIVFAIVLLFMITGLYSGRSEKKSVAGIYSFLLGLTLGLFAIFVLLDMAYIRGAFLLLPTIYGFVILLCTIKIFGRPRNIFTGEKSKLAGILNYSLILFAVFLITPGLEAISGLAPHPLELVLTEEKFSIETGVYQYPMPSEVEEIRGEIERDIDFSIYLIKPEKNQNEGSPLALLFHGFANPGYSSYTDWAETLAKRGVTVAYIQYPSDVWPAGHDTYTLHEEGGMSNHPFHVPRVKAITSALVYLETLLESNVNTQHLLVGGHSLGAGYSLIALDWALQKGWGSDSLVVDLEAPYARPVQSDLQVNLSSIPEHFIGHVVVSEDDMSVSDCFGVHHQSLLGEKSLLLEIPSDRYGYPRLVASHYLQATETHDTLADWGFYKRVAYQAEWLSARLNNDVENQEKFKEKLSNNEDAKYMGEWSDGVKVNEIKIYEDAINTDAFRYCKTWTGPD